MSAEASSLASLLTLGAGGDPAGGGGGGAGQIPQNEEDSAAILTYLHHHYGDPDQPPPSSGYSHGGPSFQQPQSHSHSHIPRSPSPVNPALQIPPQLADLANAALASPSLVDLPPTNVGNLYPVYGDRGEMGGKRRKPPHERAGWREMDEQGMIGGVRPYDSGAKRRKTAQHGGESGIEAITGGGGGGGAGGGGGSGSQGEGTDGDGRGRDSDGGKEKGANSKESRAEQNRKAQQAFRRRREEHIKKLETDSLALEPTRQRLQQVESLLSQAALALDATQLQCSALRLTLLNLVEKTRTRIVEIGGGLDISGTGAGKGAPNTREDLERAFELLERQSRELAKVKRQTRGGH